MTERDRGRTPRGFAAARFDEVTLAAFVVLLLVALGAVAHFGAAESFSRIGCGLNDGVNRLLAYPRPCR